MTAPPGWRLLAPRRSPTAPAACPPYLHGRGRCRGRCLIHRRVHTAALGADHFQNGKAVPAPVLSSDQAPRVDPKALKNVADILAHTVPGHFSDKRRLEPQLRRANDDIGWGTAHRLLKEGISVNGQPVFVAFRSIPARPDTSRSKLISFFTHVPSLLSVIEELFAVFKSNVLIFFLLTYQLLLVKLDI